MSRRTSIIVPAIAHRFPVPNACRIGDLVMSGSISGVDPETGEMPESMESQCANMFANVRSIVQAAGGTLDDIIKVTIFIRDRNNRGPLNEAWVKVFPDELSRPTRHAQLLPAEGPSLIQCDFVAVIQER
jgi:enamine deaminase RidA (YjgF/YER057c/UK114 family)